MDIQQQQVIFQDMSDAIKIAKFGTASAAGVRITPLNMTSNTPPAPYVASQSSVWDNTDQRQAWSAFAATIGALGWLAFPWGTVSGSGCAQHGTVGNDWIQIKLDKQYVANKLVLYTRVSNYTALPKKFYLSGSNDGANWTILLNIENDTFDNRQGASQSWGFKNDKLFQYYRVTITEAYDITGNIGTTGCRVGLGRVEIYSTGAPPIKPNDFASALAEIPTAYSASFAEPDMAGRSLRAKFEKIADVIRAKLGIMTRMKPAEMPGYIRQIQKI
jgi:hypothetical protein